MNVNRMAEVARRLSQVLCFGSQGKDLVQTKVRR